MYSQLQILYGLSATLNAHNLPKTMDFFGDYVRFDLFFLPTPDRVGRPHITRMLTGNHLE
jgi:hypothetical protein